MRGRRSARVRRLASVRSRLTFWNVFALTIALTAVSVQIRYSVRANILASIDRELVGMARFAGRMNAWRPRGRGQGGPMFGARPTAVGATQQSARPGVSPASAPSGPNPSSVPNSPTAASNNFTPSGPPAPQPQISQPPPRPIRGDGFASTPATRVFYNGSRTFLNEPPWDMNAYSQAIVEVTDVYSTITTSRGSHRILTRPLRSVPGTTIVVQCTFPLNEMDRAVHSLDVTLLTTIPLVLLIAGLGGAFLTDRAMRPVRQITRTAEQISAEDLSQRLPVGKDDEFAQLAATFNAMLSRLDTSFSQQRRFTADASHELKSPLTVIRANTSLALKSRRSPEEYMRRLEAIDRASNHMRLLVDDLLLLARADEGRLAAHAEPLSLNEVVLEAVESTNRPDVAHVSIKMPDAQVMMVGNRLELIRLLSNLIDNALRYTPQTGEVSITLNDESVAACIVIEDTGAGIPAEHIAHLGERFYRVDASRVRTQGGSGLGLAICRSIVEAHHGDITFRSSVGQGTTVTVTLPLDPANV